MLPRSGRLCGGDLPVGVKRALAAHRCEDDRGVPGRPEFRAWSGGDHIAVVLLQRLERAAETVDERAGSCASPS